jgi:putative hemolysin
MEKKQPIRIDVDTVVKERSKNKKVPRFLVNYLKKIAHQDEMNQFFIDHPDLTNLDFIEAALDMLGVKTVVKGRENFPPKDGRYIFVSNHPLGGLDGMATGLMVGREYDGMVKFFSNDLLTNLEPMREMFIPVNKLGSQTRQHAIMMDELYNSNYHLVTYPAGMCSRNVNGKIVDLEWKKNFIAKAVQYERDVIPIYFEGRNSTFFYNLAKLRKWLGIKFNIEMMFLADEMFKQRGKTFTITIGKKIPWQTFDKSKTQAEWAAWVKEMVYSML